MKKYLGILWAVAWLVFAGQATAQGSRTTGHLMTNDPRFCSYGYNPSCQSRAIDVREASERHFALAFSPSTGARGMSSVAWKVPGTSAAEKRALREANNENALWQCQARDCELVHSQDGWLLTAVLGLDGNGRYRIFAGPKASSAGSRLLGAIGMDLGGRNELHQTLLAECRKHVQECTVVIKTWTGYAGESAEPLLSARDAYGAVFIDETDNSRVFAAGSYLSQRDAQARAAALCRAGGGQQCSRWYWYANSCTAVASGQGQGQPIYVGVEGFNKSKTAEAALGQCRDRGGQQCQLVTSSCAMECDPEKFGCTLPAAKKG